MRIALVSDWCLPRLGGIELQVRDLALQLRARGHDVEIVTPVEGSPDLDGIPVHRLGAPRMPGAGIVYTAQAFRRIRELYLAGRYDVVHVHFGIIAPAAYGATFIAQQLGLPTTATFHSVLTHFEVPLALVRSLMGVSEWRVQWSAVSSIVARSMRPLVGDAPVALLPNGVDVNYWSRVDRTPQAADGLRAVAVMRLHRRKRPAFLVEAFARATAGLRAAGGGVTLTIIGDGKEMPALRRALRAASLEDVVTLRGWLPRDAVRAALREADVFLLPSRLEAFGIAALEARSAGVPVIGMAAGGASDFLTDGTDALLARDDEHFAQLLTMAVTDPGVLQRLRAGCGSPPAAGWDHVIGPVESAYRRSMRTSRPDRSIAAAAPPPTIAAR